jgi:hypothetical protein
MFLLQFRSMLNQLVPPVTGEQILNFFSFPELYIVLFIHSDPKISFWERKSIACKVFDI